jgi:hypothetical protein
MSRITLLFCLLVFSASALAQTTTPQDYGAQGVTYFTPPPPSLDWQFQPTISGGYSDVHFNGKSAIPYNPSGGYIDLNAYAKMPSYESPLIGLGLTASGNWDNYTIPYATAPTERSFSANTGLYSLEVRVAFPIGLPKLDDGFYISPRIGVGVLVDNFTAGQPYDDYPDYLLGAYTTHTGYGAEVRPDLEIGYRIRRFNIGCEVSYMAGWGNFGKLGDLAGDFRLGLVLGWRF